jgi:hypothetical protein
MTITTARRRPDGGGGGGAPSVTLCSTSSTRLLTRAPESSWTSTSRAVVVTRAWVKGVISMSAWTASTAAGVQASAVAGSNSWRCTMKASLEQSGAVAKRSWASRAVPQIRGFPCCARSGSGEQRSGHGRLPWSVMLYLPAPKASGDCPMPTPNEHRRADSLSAFSSPASSHLALCPECWCQAQWRAESVHMAKPPRSCQN